ncbi:transcription repressor OFP8-like [Abrus precatorius]|uniref:Transcription repressor n=1 Tax=Abrus precatorius TaxID=3816 RepID=A0A8B8KJB6_ABRPR|nr:transcription repressor OFP8-like [Abrus precatorius]
MFSNKRRLMKTLFNRNGGCGCSTPKSSDVHDPTPKPKISIYQNTNPSSLNSSTTSGFDDEDFTSTTVSEPDTLHDHKNKNNETAKPNPKLIDSIAVEKDSKDPYNDFRDSMLQMIFEREIYSEPDLQELLECFLELNATCHHQVIVQAFIEICEEAFPKKNISDDGGVSEPCRRNQMMNIRKSR